MIHAADFLLVGWTPLARVFHSYEIVVDNATPPTRLRHSSRAARLGFACAPDQSQDTCRDRRSRRHGRRATRTFPYFLVPVSPYPSLRDYPRKESLKTFETLPVTTLGLTFCLSVKHPRGPLNPDIVAS